MPDVWLPRRREAPRWDRAGRSWLLQPMCPAGQGVGSPRLVPLWTSRSTSFKLATWFLHLAPLGREQAQALDITVLPINFSDPGSELPQPSRATWGRQPWWGGRETSFRLSFLEGTQEPLDPGL